MITLRIQRVGINVQLCCVPVHVGMEVNEKPDKIAKKVLKLNDNEIMQILFRKGEAQ